MLQFSEVVLFDDVESSVDHQSYYRLQGKGGSWESCRDVFKNHFQQNVEGFFFSIKGTSHELIAEFVWNFEKILRVSGCELKHSSFSKTSRPTLLWTAPSEFWKECELRRSLFTILVRTALFYRQTNFEDCLFDFTEKGNKWARKYLKTTKEALERFMLGYTQINYEHKRIAQLSKGSQSTFGWLQVFGGVPSSALKTMLVSPSKLHNRMDTCLL